MIHINEEEKENTENISNFLQKNDIFDKVELLK